MTALTFRATRVTVALRWLWRSNIFRRAAYSSPRSRPYGTQDPAVHRQGPDAAHRCTAQMLRFRAPCPLAAPSSWCANSAFFAVSFTGRHEVRVALDAAVVQDRQQPAPLVAIQVSFSVRRERCSSSRPPKPGYVTTQDGCVLSPGFAWMEPEQATQHDRMSGCGVAGLAAFGLQAQRYPGTHLQPPAPPVMRWKWISIWRNSPSSSVADPSPPILTISSYPCQVTETIQRVYSELREPLVPLELVPGGFGRSTTLYCRRARSALTTRESALAPPVVAASVIDNTVLVILRPAFDPDEDADIVHWNSPSVGIQPVKATVGGPLE